MASTKSKHEQRYKIVSDESGHDYVIPVEMDSDFYKWVEETEADRETELDFNDYRVEGGLTFTDPKY